MGSRSTSLGQQTGSDSSGLVRGSGHFKVNGSGARVITIGYTTTEQIERVILSQMGG